MAQVYTYTFLDVKASVAGPGGGGSFVGGNADEGFEVEYVEEKTTTTPSADGGAMHVLNASKVGKFRARLLKTSPLNAMLSAMYGFQETGGATWGQNTITLQNVNTGDNVNAQACAFTKFPKVVWSKAGPMNEWEWNVGILDVILGTGTPDIAA